MLMLLPGGEWSGTVDVRGRAPTGGGYVVRTDFVGPRGAVSEVCILSNDRIRELTGTDLDAAEIA